MRFACVYICVAGVSFFVWSHLCTVFVPSSTLMDFKVTGPLWWRGKQTPPTRSYYWSQLARHVTFGSDACAASDVMGKKARKKGHGEARVHLFLAQTQTYSEWKDIKQQHHQSIARLVSLTWWATAQKAFDIQGEKPVGCNLMWFVFADSFLFIYLASERNTTYAFLKDSLIYQNFPFLLCLPWGYIGTNVSCCNQ